MGEVGDGAMAVLEVEGVEELLGALGADLGEGLAQGEGGAGVLGHGVGEDLGLGSVDGVDVGCGCGGVLGHGHCKNTSSGQEVLRKTGELVAGHRPLHDEAVVKMGHTVVWRDSRVKQTLGGRVFFRR